MWPKLNPLETKMAKISHTKIKQPSFEKKKAKINLHKNFPIYGTMNSFYSLNTNYHGFLWFNQPQSVVQNKWHN
jgi:hypothetical protein